MEVIDKIWLDSYPANMPEHINADRYDSLAEFIAEQCEKYSDSVAFENFDSQITYREFDLLSQRFAAYLQTKLRLQKGDRFAIMLPNILQFPIALYAALRAGLVVVNVNPLYTVRELTHQLNDAEVKAIIVMANFSTVVQEALPLTDVKHVIVTKMGDCLSGVKGPLINLYLKYIRRDVPKWEIP